MPRPSMQSEREAQILDACERCIARVGVAGTTLDRVAEEAGLARQLIRHNVGNREVLLRATVERYVKRSEADLAALIAALPENQALLTMVEWLFEDPGESPQTAPLSDAFVNACQDEPWLAARVQAWTRGFFAAIEMVAQQTYPSAALDDVKAVSAGIAASYLTAQSVARMGEMELFYSGCREAALRLSRSLAE